MHPSALINLPQIVFPKKSPYPTVVNVIKLSHVEFQKLSIAEKSSVPISCGCE